eukprot:scaffold1982_cov93-Amphora_coffeaeformis.AAC.32
MQTIQACVAHALDPTNNNESSSSSSRGGDDGGGGGGGGGGVKVRVQRWYPCDFDESDEHAQRNETTLTNVIKEEDTTIIPLTAASIPEVPPATQEHRSRRRRVCSVPVGGSLFGKDTRVANDNEHRAKLVLADKEEDEDEVYDIRISKQALQTLRTGDATVESIPIQPDLSPIHHLHGLVRTAHSN